MKLTVGYLTCSKHTMIDGFKYMQSAVSYGGGRLYSTRTLRIEGIEAGNRIKYIPINPNDVVHGVGKHIDQLILIDDARKLIYSVHGRAIDRLREYLRKYSPVPEEFQVQELIW